MRLSLAVQAFFLVQIILLPAVAAQEPAERTQDNYETAAEAVVSDWTEELGPTFRALARLPEERFIEAWDAEIADWQARLDDAATTFDADPALVSRYRDRLHYEWAVGRLFYDVYHRDLTGDHGFTTSDSYDAWLERVELDRADLLDLEEYTFFISRLRTRRADALFEPRDLPGSVKYLTARLLAAEGFGDEEVACWLDGEALEDWLEDNAADGMTGEVEAYAAACPGERADEIMEIHAAEIALRDGHPIEIYKTVDGHELEIHLYPPEGWEEGDPLQPGVIFLHGGGWFFGSWSWCGPCQFFKDRGMMVAQLEYRTRGRHGTDVRDAYEDARDAIAWLRNNGARYGADPERLAISGFSAGAHLSLAAASLREDDNAPQPDMAISFSGCTDLVRDPYTVRMSGSRAEARALSPLYQVNPASPPIFMVNATEDTDCNYEAARDFADKAAEAGVDIEFMTQEDAGHFFLRDPERAARTRERVDAFMTRHGF